MCSILNLFHLIEDVGEAIMEGVCLYLFFAWSLVKEGWLLWYIFSMFLFLQQPTGSHPSSIYGIYFSSPFHGAKST